MKLSCFGGIENLKTYNKFFHPNVCHVCKTTTQNKLTPCSACYMISYCSEEHKLWHWPEHEEICIAIRTVSKMWNFWNTRGMTTNEWVTFKRDNVRRIKELIDNVEPYEEQMFLFAKSCLICRQQTNLVTTCKECYSINSCIDHIDLTNIEHDCARLRFSLFLDIEYSRNEPNIKFMLFDCDISMHNFPCDIKSFVTYYQENYTHNYRFWQHLYYYCDLVSEPLTICKVMQDPRYCYLAYKQHSFIIHIIAGSKDADTWPAWELLLHMLPKNITVQITVLEPESEDIYVPTRYLCKTCTLSRKSLSVKWYGMSYNDYELSSLYTQPDIIIGFHAELKKFNRQTIKALDRQKCPLLLTTKSKSEADNNVKRLQKIVGPHGMASVNTKNSFRSLKPCRDYENDRIFFPNEYLIIWHRSDLFINLI